MTGNHSLENAITWIDEHTNDPDFEDELQVVGVKETPKLTDLEIKQQAIELRLK